MLLPLRDGNTPYPAIMPSAFSLRQLADHLGLSHATVSEALRDSPRVKLATRQRVAAAALELGYQRNPLASALMGEMRRSRGGVFRGSVALLETTLSGPASGRPSDDTLLRGAMRQAESMGFTVDRVRLDRQGCHPTRVGEIFAARGIRGVLILPGLHADEARLIDWSQVTAVIAGEPWPEAPFHAVSVDGPAAIWQSLRRLAAMGHHRPGLVLDPTLDTHRLREDTAAYLAHFHDAPENPGAAERVFTFSETKSAALAAWMQQCACDGLLVQSPAVLERLRTLCPPGEATPALCCLDLEGDAAMYAGVYLRREAVGRRAMEVLVEQVLKNERGAPAVQSITRVAPLWVPGPGLRVSADLAA